MRAPVTKPGVEAYFQYSEAPLAAMTSINSDKWIGLMLAISSSIAIGTSFIITKKVRMVHLCLTEGVNERSAI